MALLVSGILLTHLPVVQRSVWHRIVQTVKSETGWQLDAESARFRLLPGSVVIRGLTVETGESRPIWVDAIEIHFRWHRLLASPRFIDRVVVEGPLVDLRMLELPAGDNQPSQEGEPLMWRTLEIGKLQVRDGRLMAAAAEVELDVERLKVAGRLRDGSAVLSVDAGVIRFGRQGRTLNAGSLEADIRVGGYGFTVQRLRMAGDATSLSASGNVMVSPELAGRGSLHAEADLVTVSEWWEPTQSLRLKPRGRLAVDASFAYDPEGGLQIALEHRGSPVELAGFSIDGLVVEHGGGVSRARVDLGPRGWLEVASDGSGRVDAEAELTGVDVDPVLALAGQPAWAAIPEGLMAGCRIAGSFPLPLTFDQVTADGWVRFDWPEGRVLIEAAGGGRAWNVRRLEFDLPGASGEGEGSLRDGVLNSAVRAFVADPAKLTDFAAAWAPELGPIEIGGGPISVDLAASGPLGAPSIAAEVAWTEPHIGAVAIDEIRASASGTLDDLQWTVNVDLDGATRLRSEGRTAFPSLETSGRWAATAPSLDSLPMIVPGVPADVVGGLEGGGEFAWGPEQWRVDGSVAASRFGVGTHMVDGMAGSFQLSQEGASFSGFELQLGGASARLEGSLAPLALDGWAQMSLRVDNLDPEELGLNGFPAGTVSVSARVDGTVLEPAGTVDLQWDHVQSETLADPLKVHVELAGGTVEATVQEWRTAAGPVHGEATIPLGGVPRPEWLWSGAPEGPIRARMTGIGLRSGPLVEALGVRPLPGEAAGDLAVDVVWDLEDPEARHVLLELFDVTIKGEHMDLASESTLRARFLDGRIEVEPVALAGPRSHVDFGGVYDLRSDRLVGAVDLNLSARIVEMLPFSVQATGPIRIQAAVDGPLTAPTATLSVDHHGGSIVMRDPAVEITDLHLEIEVDDGVVWIQDGEAGLNRGRLLVGGGWDPVSGQGVVLEVEEVKALLGTSIVTSWSGAIAIEPDPDHPAKVVGELALEAGVWDRPFDLRSALLGPADVETDEEDPLNNIALDLVVAGYGGIRVDNNLGRFDASWGTLEVGGTVGRPELIGTVRLAPGGTVNLPGQAVTIRRATLDFTGNPETDPIMEIVPEKYSVGLGGSENPGNQLDTRQLAAETLARSAGSVLGLENTTLQPAEVAFQTQTDASSAFTAGQRLTRNVAVFLTTDLSDVQSQTTMVQLWNLRGLPGLAIQGYTKTGDANQGANLIERYRWGGSETADHRPVIQRIKLEGEWPASKRQLRRAAGLRKGEPFEPFLLFAAGLRLETTLAEQGYPRARVTGEAVGDPALPALVFSVDTGPRQEVIFTGDSIPAHVRRTTIGLYREPPVEHSSLGEMRRTVLRHLLGDGFPEAVVTVERAGDAIVVDSVRGPRLTLLGPVVEGLSEEEAVGLRGQVGTPMMLAELIRDREWSARLVARALRLEGFPDARLEDVWLTDGDDGSRWVHLRIDPGARQRLAAIEVRGEDPLGLTPEGIPGIEAGMPLNRQRIGQALSRLRSTYRAAGYSEVDIEMALEDAGDAGWFMGITLSPGTQRTLRAVEVTGLRHVREKVILGGLAIEPGEVLVPADLDTSAIRTAFFSPVERANITTRDVGANLADVTLDVAEKPRWTVEAGAGWSSERGASLQFGLRDDGLLGRGAGLSFRGLWDERQQQATLYASLPPLPGGRWSMVANFLWFSGDSRVSPDTYREEQLGGAAEATYSITDTTSVRGYLRRLKTVSEHKKPWEFPPGLAPDPVTSHETIVGSQMVWDRLDNPFDPRSGSAVALDLSHNAPSLGSDLNDLRIVLTGSLVTAPSENWTWAQVLRLGGVEGLGGTIPSTNRRFFAGGQATVRGFDLDSIGPVIPGQDGSVAKGGGALFVLNEELRIPIVANIRAAVFADVGQVWESWGEATPEFSVGAGFGLRLATPVGPLWADVAWPVVNPNISSPGAKYYFGLGTNF